MLAIALTLLAAAGSGSGPRTIMAPVDEYLGPVRAGAAAPHEPGSIRLVRDESRPEAVEAISSETVRVLLAPCVRGDTSSGPVPPRERLQFRIRQHWRCEGADGYAGIIATFVTTPRAERLQDVELVLRAQPFAPPSPPPPSWPAQRRR